MIAAAPPGPADAALALFTSRPEAGKKIDWLANQILLFATQAPTLLLRVVHDPAGSVQFEVADGENRFVSTDRTPLRLFRPLLARLAKMAEEESGQAFRPYGGTIRFSRPSASGLISLEIEFENTSQSQRARISRQVAVRPAVTPPERRPSRRSSPLSANRLRVAGAASVAASIAGIAVATFAPMVGVIISSVAAAVAGCLLIREDDS